MVRVSKTSRAMLKDRPFVPFSGSSNYFGGDLVECDLLSPLSALESIGQPHVFYG